MTPSGSCKPLLTDPSGRVRAHMFQLELLRTDRASNSINVNVAM